MISSCAHDLLENGHTFKSLLLMYLVQCYFMDNGAKFEWFVQIGLGLLFHIQVFCVCACMCVRVCLCVLLRCGFLAHCLKTAILFGYPNISDYESPFIIHWSLYSIMSLFFFNLFHISTCSSTNIIWSFKNYLIFKNYR